MNNNDERDYADERANEYATHDYAAHLDTRGDGHQGAYDPVRRARMVANIRALADLIEATPSIPAPTSCRAQFTLLAEYLPDPAGRMSEVCRIAAVIGATVRGPGATLCFGGELSDWETAEYTIHAQPEPAEPLPSTAPSWLVTTG